MKNSRLILLFIFFCIVFPVHAENDMVHKFAFELNTLIYKDSIRDPEYAANFLWEPDVFGDFKNCEILFKPVLLFHLESKAETNVKINGISFFM